MVPGTIRRLDRVVIAVDLGTSGLKVGLVTLGGDVRWSEHADIPMERVGARGYEQDAAGWWDLVTAMLRRGLASGAADPSTVRAVACTGQWASTVPVDERGKPVGPCIVWMDTRGGEHAAAAVGGPVAGYAPVALARWLRRTAAIPPASGKGPLGQHLQLLRDRRDIADAARWFLEPVDYLTMRFSGRAAATQASMIGSFLVDIRRLDRLAYDADLVRWAGLDASKLPPLVATGSVVGPILPELAADLGLPDDVAVIAGAPDLHTAQAGSGAVMPGQAHLVISTTSWISCPFDRKKTDLRHEVTTMPGPVQGSYCVFNNVDTAGACLDWYRRAVGQSFEQVLGAAAASPPGANGVVFTPWLNGAQAPTGDAKVRAGFQNVGLATTGGDLARAVLEGVAVHNGLLLGAVERFVGARLDPLRVIGGGARSDLWCQIHADALGRTIERPAGPLDAGLRGAALAAAFALGAIGRGDVAGLVPAERVFRPEPAHGAVYAKRAAAMKAIRRPSRRLRALVR